jgi:hypothetical protein
LHGDWDGKVMAEGIYRIELNGIWSLEDFYQFPHILSQTYSFEYVFHRDESSDIDIERVAHAFSSYPWEGGYSAVNFYRVLNSQVPPRFRPDVKSVRYESPGWMDLHLVLETAKAIGTTVAVVSGAVIAATKAYNDVYRGLRERELLRIKAERSRIRLSRDKIEFAVMASQTIANMMGFKNLVDLNMLTNDNPLANLKILMSYYRRIRTLVDFSESEKATFPEGEEKR